MINVTLGEKPKEESQKPFPKLMEIKYHDTDNEGTIVFMVCRGQGVVIHGVGYYKHRIGHITSAWDMSHFTDYNEPITIQNA